MAFGWPPGPADKGAVDKVLQMMESSHNSEALNALYDAVLRMEDRGEVQRFLADLCTRSELNAMAQRYLVAKMLRDAKTGNEIIRRTGSSTATISRVNRSLRYGAGGYALALDREEEEKRNHEAERETTRGD